MPSSADYHTIIGYASFWAALRRPRAGHLLTRLRRLDYVPDAVRSPVLFVHGFPDSPQMFAAYHTPAERSQIWLQGRSVYTIAFPNRQSNPASLPSICDLLSGRLRREFAGLVDAAIATSPTGKIIVVAHDWGATYTWELIRSRPDLPIERFVSLSVGSSFRYDLGAHGIRALLWLYNVAFGLPYYLPSPAINALTAAALKRAGYRSTDIGNVYRDSYHYWDWPLRLILLPFRLLGAGAQPAFTDIRFPVLFMRSHLDSIASTRPFEEYLRQRDDCRVVLLEGVSHWFPEQDSERVLTEIRSFVI